MIHDKQIHALKLAIEIMTKECRQYAAGYVAYIQQKIRPAEIKGDDVTGTVMSFAESEHAKYKELNDAIQEIEDFIDILTDPGVTYNNNSDLPMFQKGNSHE